MTDLSVFDLPVNTAKEDIKDSAEIEQLILTKADMIANFDLTKEADLKNHLLALHKHFQTNPDLPYILTDEARAVYFKSLEHVSSLFLDDVQAKNSKPKPKKLDNHTKGKIMDLTL